MDLRRARVTDSWPAVGRSCVGWGKTGGAKGAVNSCVYVLQHFSDTVIVNRNRNCNRNRSAFLRCAKKLINGWIGECKIQKLMCNELSRLHSWRFCSFVCIVSLASVAHKSVLYGVILCFFSSFSQEQICELYQLLYDSECHDQLTKFEDIVINVIKDVRKQQCENERLERSYQRFVIDSCTEYFYLFAYLLSPFLCLLQQRNCK